MHATDVAAVQLLVEQSAVASAAVAVASVVAKSMPVNVTLADIKATLYGANAVNTGAVKYKDTVNNPKDQERSVHTKTHHRS